MDQTDTDLQSLALLNHIIFKHMKSAFDARFILRQKTEIHPAVKEKLCRFD